MKIYINRKPVRAPWGGGAHFFNNFHDLTSQISNHQIVGEETPIDVILLAGLDNDGSGISADQAVMYKMMMQSYRDVKIVLRVNENDARKATHHMDRMLVKLSEHIDGTVFVSEWLSDYFVKMGWKNANTTVIKNGVDQTIFTPQPKFNNGKVNIVSHHWSSHPLKGQDITEKLDEFVGHNPDKFTFTFIGRTQATLKHSRVVSPMFGTALGKELGQYDVYVSASRWDPGPNHVTESISCGLPTFVHKDGGGSVEFAGKQSVYSSWEELKTRLINKDYPTEHPKTNDWATCIQAYLDFLEKTCK